MKGIALLSGIIGAAVVVSAFCVFGPGRADATEEQVVVIAPVQPAYARQIDVAFEGGRARVGLLDEEAAMEFDLPNGSPCPSSWSGSPSGLS